MGSPHLLFSAFLCALRAFAFSFAFAFAFAFAFVVAFSTPYSLLLTLYSLLSTPYSLLLIHYSLFTAFRLGVGDATALLVGAREGCAMA
jgi:hypothetical protein